MIRRLYWILALGFLQIPFGTAGEPRTSPVFTAEPQEDVVEAKTIPILVYQRKEDRSHAIRVEIGGRILELHQVPPTIAGAVESARKAGRPCTFILRSFHSTSYPSGRIYIESRALPATRAQNGKLELNTLTRRKTLAPTRILDGDNILYDIGTCEIHGEKLSVASIPISYGLMGVNRHKTPSSDTTWRQFPHGETEAHGGCCVSSESPEFQQVFQCKSCLEARNNWLNHPVPSESLAAERKPLETARR